jgi:hypothetical protein
MMGGPTNSNTNTNHHPVQLLMSFLSGAATVWMLQYAYTAQQQQRRRRRGATKETSRLNGTRVW